MTTIYEHLNFIQKHLNAPKNRINKFGGYNYRNCEDIVEAVKKILPEGCSVVLRDEIVMIGDRFYVKAVAVLLSGSGSIESSALARESLDKKGMDSAQITGAASSYARKYALNGLFAIDDSDDIDSKDNTQEAKKSPQPESRYINKEMVKPMVKQENIEQPIPSQAPKKESKDTDIVSKEMVFKLSKLTFDAKLDTKKLYETYKVKDLAQLNVGQAKEIAERCKDIIADKNNNELSKAASKVFGKEDYVTV